MSTENLPNKAKERYREKIAVIGGLDPFGGCPGEAIKTLPPIDASDLVSYLVFYHSSTVQGPQVARGLQPVCVWMGQGCLYVESCWKICDNWTSKCTPKC